MTPAFTDPAAFAGRNDRFRRTIHARNAIEYAAGGICLALFGALAAVTAAHGEAGLAAACVLLCAGIAAVLWRLRRDGSAAKPRPEEAGRAYLRGELVRQRDLLRAVPRWYLAPLIPGMAAFYAAVFAKVAAASSVSAAWANGWHVPAVIAGGFVGIALLNRWAADRLDREIAALDALG